MALTLLPEEVLEEIVKHLTVRDLLSCSAVSLEWREKFNVDMFWKRFCTTEIKDYLENNPCEVEPTFALPLDNEERLEPICFWRIHYMRKVHLLNNWKCHRSLSRKVRSAENVISSEICIDCEGVHWLFIRTTTEIEIWNIKNTPQLNGVVPIFLACPIVNVFIAGKKAVIAQWNIVNVYELPHSKETLKIVCKFVLEEETSLSKRFWDISDANEMKFINFEDDYRYACFENLLVGYRRMPSPPTDLSMYIWDVEKGQKIKVVPMMNPDPEVLEFAFINIFKSNNTTGLIRIVFRSSENVLYSQMYVYDFKKQLFTDIDIRFEGVTAWCGCTKKILVTFTSHPGTIRFYDYFSGKLISIKEIGEYANSETMQLVDSYLLYCMFSCMNVLNIHNQEVVYCLQFSLYSFVRRVTVIKPRFVVVWLLERGISPGCPSFHQEVWDIKDFSNKLLVCSSELGYEMATSSSSIIKQLISFNRMLYVYTFW